MTYNISFSDRTREHLMEKPFNLTDLQWHYLFESNYDPLFLMDDEYNIIECNLKAVEVYGYDKAEFTGLNMNDIRAPYTREEIEGAMKKSIDEHGVVFETRLRRKDGSEFYVEVSTKPFSVGGKLIYLHTVRDITTRKRAEEELKFSEERNRNLVEFSPIAIMILCENKILYINPAGMKLFGALNNEQVIGMSVFDFIHSDYHKITEARISDLKEGMAESVVEEKIVNLQGDVIDVEIMAIPVKHKSLPTIEVFMHDITIRKRAEVYSSFLAAVVESSKHPIIVCSLDSSIIYWNKGAEMMFGYSSRDISNKLLLKIISPENSDKAMVMFEKVRKGHLVESHKMKVKKKDGEIIDVFFTISPIVGPTGEAGGISIFTQSLNNVNEREDS